MITDIRKYQFLFHYSLQKVYTVNLLLGGLPPNGQANFTLNASLASLNHNGAKDFAELEHLYSRERFTIRIYSCN
jgi:hypothetical protein